MKQTKEKCKFYRIEGMINGCYWFDKPECAKCAYFNSKKNKDKIKSMTKKMICIPEEKTCENCGYNDGVHCSVLNPDAHECKENSKYWKPKEKEKELIFYAGKNKEGILITNFFDLSNELNDMIAKGETRKFKITPVDCKGE